MQKCGGGRILFMGSGTPFCKRPPGNWTECKLLQWESPVLIHHVMESFGQLPCSPVQLCRGEMRRPLIYNGTLKMSNSCLLLRPEYLIRSRYVATECLPFPLPFCFPEVTDGKAGEPGVANKRHSLEEEGSAFTLHWLFWGLLRNQSMISQFTPISRDISNKDKGPWTRI